jgi:alpha-tubulin suppressor-like RCC1 family protein
MVAFASISPPSSPSQSTWAWGYNPYGQLGEGSTNDSSSPVGAGGLSGVTAISAGNSHSVAHKSDGSVSGWGDNEYGEGN